MAQVIHVDPGANGCDINIERALRSHADNLTGCRRISLSIVEFFSEVWKWLR